MHSKYIPTRLIKTLFDCKKFRYLQIDELKLDEIQFSEFCSILLQKKDNILETVNLNYFVGERQDLYYKLFDGIFRIEKLQSLSL